MSLTAGSRRGPYKVLGPLGRGGGERCARRYAARTNRGDSRLFLASFRDTLAIVPDLWVSFHLDGKSLGL
jgi:hypothetical protein